VPLPCSSRDGVVVPCTDLAALRADPPFRVIREIRGRRSGFRPKHDLERGLTDSPASSARRRVRRGAPRRARRARSRGDRVHRGCIRITDNYRLERPEHPLPPPEYLPDLPKRELFLGWMSPHGLGPTFRRKVDPDSLERRTSSAISDGSFTACVRGAYAPCIQVHQTALEGSHLRSIEPNGVSPGMSSSLPGSLTLQRQYVVLLQITASGCSEWIRSYVPARSTRLAEGSRPVLRALKDARGQ